MEELKQIIAEQLLQIKAIKLQLNNPFVWASGWNSPIYCDNRKTLSYPDVRNLIKAGFVRLIKEHYPDVEVVAGVATGAIAQGVLVAQELNLPFVYVRSAPKGHGLENLIEGDLKPGQKVLVIEDLISTGGSSLKAVEALRAESCDVIAMMAIFSYEFPVAEESFKNADVQLVTMSNYSTLLDVALKKGIIGEGDLEILREWRKKPSTWGKNNTSDDDSI